MDLWSTSLIFNKGHRIRVAVSSSNSPRFEANPNTGKPFRADKETRVAKNTLHLSAKHSSHIVLPVMKEVDRYLLDSLHLDGRKPRVVCLPTAAGREGDSSINRWSNMGIQHFTELGADVNALRIIDQDSANDPHWEPFLEEADLIYFSGGDPGYLYQTMKASRAWSAAQRAWQRGAIYAGCSAGAMILAKRMPSFRLAGTQEGFGIVPATFIGLAEWPRKPLTPTLA